MHLDLLARDRGLKRLAAFTLRGLTVNGQSNPATRPVDIIRVVDAAAGRADDVSAAEEPLEIRLDDEPFVVTMRTPGADADLAAGFLLSENIVRGAEEIAGMRHCARSDNILYVTLAGDAAQRAAEAMTRRRHVTTTSACGVCGRRSIDERR